MNAFNEEVKEILRKIQKIDKVRFKLWKKRQNLYNELVEQQNLQKVVNNE